MPGSLPLDLEPSPKHSLGLGTGGLPPAGRVHEPLPGQGFPAQPCAHWFQAKSPAGYCSLCLKLGEVEIGGQEGKGEIDKVSSGAPTNPFPALCASTISPPTPVS